MQMPLSQTNHNSLVRRTRHALEHRHDLLTPREISFLMDIEYWLGQQKKMSISHKQLPWLEAILERVSTKNLKRVAAR